MKCLIEMEVLRVEDWSGVTKDEGAAWRRVWESFGHIGHNLKSIPYSSNNLFKVLDSKLPRRIELKDGRKWVGSSGATFSDT